MSTSSPARREAEEALRQSEEKLRAIVRSARDYAIFTTGLDRRITSWSAGAEIIFGYSEGEIIGQDIDLLFSADYRVAGLVENELRSALENGHIGNECWHARKGGEHFWGSGTTAPLRDAAGKTVGYLKIVQDQTGRRLMEVEIQAHIRQQAVVAQFGQRVLVATELEALLGDAVSLVAEILEVEHCALLELLPEENALVFRKGVGWEAEVSEHLRLSTDVGFDVGYSLYLREPVIVNDASKEARFRLSPRLSERGVVAGVGVVVEGEQQPFGLLWAHSDRARKFSEYDIHFLESMANMRERVTPATGRVP